MVTYTGEVKPGGAPDTRELSVLTVTKVAVDPEMSNNAYLLRCNATGDQVLIDAAAEPATLLPLIGDAGLAAVVTTHQHWDHHRALAEWSPRPGPTVVVGTPDADAVTEQTGVSVDRRVGDGDTVAVGDCTLEVIAIAGHTPGSIAPPVRRPVRPSAPVHRRLAVPRRGRNTDSRGFASAHGRPGGQDFDRLPDDTWFYPGHGNDSTLGAERPHLDEWRARGW